MEIKEYIPDTQRKDESLFELEEERLENEFNEKLQEAQKEGEPRIVVNIFFSAHRTAKDMEGLEKPFTHCDIFIPEASGWTDEILEYHRQVSAGALTPEEALKKMDITIEHSFYFAKRKILEILYNSQRPLTLIDLPQNNEILNRYNIAQGLIAQDLLGIEMGSVHSYLDQKFVILREHLENSAKLEIEREEFMLQNLYPQVQKLFLAHPQLKNKEHLNVLLFLGAAHTKIYHTLKKFAQSTKRDMGCMPYAFNTISEIKRRYMFGKEVSDKLIITFIFEYLWLDRIVYPNLELISNNSNKIKLFVKKLLSSFTADEMREINMKKNTALFLSKLNEKNIKLPQTEKELDAMIQWKK